MRGLPCSFKVRLSTPTGITGQPLYIIHCKVLCAYLLSVHGNGGVSCCVRNRWGGCDTDNGNNRNLTDPVSVEMVLGIVSDNAAMYCGYVGNHCTV